MSGEKVTVASSDSHIPAVRAIRNRDGAFLHCDDLVAWLRAWADHPTVAASALGTVNAAGLTVAAGAIAMGFGSRSELGQS